MFRPYRRLLAAGLVALSLGGCDKDAPEEALTERDIGAPVRIIASEHLRFLEHWIEDIRVTTGLQLSVDYRDELSIAKAIADPDTPYALAWPMSMHYLDRLAAPEAHARASLFSSPVAVGLSTDAERALGWCASGVTWRDLAGAGDDGPSAIAMARPQPGNSAYLALLAAAQSAGDAAVSGLAQQHQYRLPAGPAGVHRYATIDDRRSVMICLEAALRQAGSEAGVCRASLGDIAPVADFPLVLIRPSERPVWRTLATYLQGTDAQARLGALGFEVQDDDPFDPPGYGGGLPDDRATVDAQLGRYADARKASRHLLILNDVSGPTGGEMGASLRTVLAGLAQPAHAPLEQFDRLRPGDQVTLIPFAANVQPGQTWMQAPAGVPIGEALAGAPAANAAGDGLRAIYSAVQRAYNVAYRGLLIDPRTDHQVVLIASGESTGGLGKDTFAQSLSYMRTRLAGLAQVPTYTVAATESAVAPLVEVSTLTGGTTFSATAENIAEILNMIRSKP